MSQNEYSGSVRTGPVISASQSDIPQSFMSSNAPRPMAGRIAQKLAIASTASQSASGTVLIPLGCGAGQGFIKSGSVYLRFTIAISQAANSCGFNMTGDAQAVIQRATLYLNGQIAEQINNYNRIQGALDIHGLNTSYADSDLAVTSLKGVADLVDGGAGVLSSTQTVTIPIKMGLLNAQQDLPLFLFNTAQLEFNLETLNNAIFSITSASTGYTVSSVQLIYSVFYPEQEYEMSMRQVLASGKLFQIPIKTWYNLQVANSAGVKSVPIGLNMSSVLGVFHFVHATPASPTTAVLYTGDTPANQGLRVFLDGQLVNSYSIQDTATIFSEMKKALNLFADPDRSSYGFTGAGTAGFNPVALTRTTFLSNAFFGGLSLARTFESGLAMVGTAVGQMIVEVDCSATVASTLHICTAYEQILTVDATGSISLIR
jgi:hypothetical protein